MKVKFRLSQIFYTLFTEEESNKDLLSSANNEIDYSTNNIPSVTDLTGHNSTHDLVLLALY